MNFLEILLDRLKSADYAPVVQEIHADRLETASGKQLLELMACEMRVALTLMGCAQLSNLTPFHVSRD